jgi:hypothetical protein
MAKPPTMTGARANPPFVKQAPDWQGCLVACGRKGAKEALGSAVDLRVLTYQRARRLMGASASGPTNSQQVERMWQSLGMSRGVHYRPLFYRPWAEARDLAKQGWSLIWFVWYAHINSNARDWSGDRNFNGGHAIYTKHRWFGAKTRMWMFGEHDPLHDGRRNNIPQGPVRIPQKHLRLATQRYAAVYGNRPANNGLFVGFAVRRP